LVLLESDVKTIFSFSCERKSTVYLHLKLLTRIKRRKDTLETKRYCWTWAFILETEESRTGCDLYYFMKKCFQRSGEEFVGYPLHQVMTMIKMCFCFCNLDFP
jgi:hypothetical protein